MAGRPRIYEEVDKEMKLEELVRTACDLFGPPYDDREPDMLTRKSIREVGRIMGLSQEKTRRLLIEGGWYSTQETRSVRKLMRQGLKDDEIAKELDIPVKKVSSLKPYKDSRIYGIGTVNAQRNKEYRRRKSEDEHSVVSMWELSKRAGISQPQISVLESGKYQLKRKAGEKLAAVLEVGVDWLLTGDEEKKDFPVDKAMVNWLWQHPEVREELWKRMKDEMSGQIADEP